MDMLAKHEAEKLVNDKPELEERVALIEARLQGLGMENSSGAISGTKDDSLNRVPFDYPKNTSPMPHFNNSGVPPQFDGSHFSHWKSSMESHIRSCSVELWEIIVSGVKEPQHPTNLSSREFYERQLNETARDKIRSAIHRKLLDQVNDITSAKRTLG